MYRGEIMRYLKKILICAVVTINFTISDVCSYAVNNNVTQMQSVELKQNNNGGSVSIKKDGNNRYILDFDTNNLKEGYYTAYLYNFYKDSSDWTKYSGISFYIKNESADEVNFNINVKTKDNKILTVNDEDSILIQKSVSSYLERVHPLYGTAKIDLGYEGIVYIPFNVLKENENSIYNPNNISNVDSWGIIVTSKENDEKKIILGDFNFINPNSDLKKDFEAHYSVKGDSDVQIPTAGESISNYKLIDNKTNEPISDNVYKVEYYIDGDEEGVSINNDGRLTVNNKAEAKKIKAYAVINDEFKEEFEIQLIKSWTLSVREVDGTLKSIPTENEINNSLILKIKSITSKKVITGFRIFGSLITVGIVLLYWMWKSQRKEKLN